MGDIFKRMVAFVIDWNLCLLPSIAIICLLTPLLQSDLSIIYILLFFVLILASFIVFVLRDVIFKGRSIGKRLFKLHIIDKATKLEASTGKRIVKNLFFCIYPIDGLVLFISGDSIGNFVTNTEVISEKTIAKRNHTEYTPVSKVKTALVILGVLAIIVASAVAMYSFVQGMLNKKKDSEEYKLAYSYLIESETFDKFEKHDYNETDIRFSGFSTMTHLTHSHKGATKTTTITFSIGGSSLPVICHNINDEWQVCEDCTPFN